MKKKSCRMTENERQKHERAVKLRKMTDDQLCAYVDSLEGRERKSVPSIEDFIRHLAGKVGSGNGIGQSTVDKIARIAMEDGFMGV